MEELKMNIKQVIDEVSESGKKLEKDEDILSELENLELEYEDNAESDSDNVIKCGAKTDPSALAYFITKEFESKADCVIIQTIGAPALSKAVFAIIRLKGLVAPYIDGSTLVARFSVRKLMLGGEEKTAVRIRLFPIPDRYIV